MNALGVSLILIGDTCFVDGNFAKKHQFHAGSSCRVPTWMVLLAETDRHACKIRKEDASSATFQSCLQDSAEVFFG